MNQSIQISNEEQVLQFEDFSAMKRSRLFFLEKEKQRQNQLLQTLSNLNALCQQLKEKFDSMGEGDWEQLNTLDEEKKQLVQGLESEKERKATIKSENLQLKKQIQLFESMHRKEQQKKEEEKLLSDFKKVQTEMKKQMKSLASVKIQLQQKQNELFQLELQKMNKSFALEQMNNKLEKKEGGAHENQKMPTDEIVQLAVSFLAKLKGKDQARAKNMILNYARNCQ